MDIKIRELEEHVVQRLDLMAKNKKQSRQEFLQEQLEKLAADGEISQHEKGYKDMLEKVLYVLQESTSIMKMLREELLLDENIYDKDL